MTDDLHDLGVLLDSSCPLVLAETVEEARCLAAIRTAAGHRGHAVWTWSATRGLVRDGGDRQYGTEDLATALESIPTRPGPAVFVLADAHHHLDDPIAARHLREAVQALPEGSTIVVTAPDHDVPAELAPVAAVWRHRPPNGDVLRTMVLRTADDLRERGFRVALDDAAIDRMARALRGLPLARAEGVLRRHAVEDRVLDRSDVARIRVARAEAFADDGVLELVEPDGPTLAELGGIDGLTHWLDVRGRVLAEPVDGLPAPRGVLLAGVPGCGKSAVAKAVARSWDLPLVLLDPGRIFDRWVGESEGRLRRALYSVEAMSPAVLWIDEVEKGFGATDHDGGATRRVLGTFLRWLQDRPDGVFVVATANDVTALPPEFFRRGRVDEVFFLDLPDRSARSTILSVHLGRRGHEPSSFPLDGLAAATEGFSGAELEAAVVGAMYRALDGPGVLTPALLADEIGRTVPLAVARGEEIAALRAWAEGRARVAAAVGAAA